ncbi:MAG TPA: RcnB family protein [Rhizomicrobium sp.]|nr:RcnB family protein [Rhizomicrobium sp.]
MRKLLLSTAALIWLAVPALAEPHSDRGERHSNRVGKASVAPQVQDRAQAELRGRTEPDGGNRGQERRGEIRGNAPAAVANRGDHDSGDRGSRGDRDRSDRGFKDRIENRNDHNRDGRERFSTLERRDRMGGPDRRPDFNRDGRTDYRTDYRRGGYGGPRHDFSGFRDYHRNFRVSRRFDVPAYRRPAGWYSHRWTFGEFLPAAFWIRDYWILDFELYDLPLPPYGAVWVRVGSDALLIDEVSGEIITVAYDVFY